MAATPAAEAPRLTEASRLSAPSPSPGAAAAPRDGVNEMPPLKRAVPLAVQHLLAMFVGNAAPALIVGGAIGMATSEVTLMVQIAMIMSGVATLLQTLGVGPVGARLPVMQGTSFAFLAVAIPIGNEYGIGAVFGGAVIAGVVQVVFGGSMRWLARLFPPFVAGIIILIIGISLMPTAINYAAGGSPAEAAGDLGALKYYGVAAVVVIVTVALNQFTRGFTSVAAVLIGLIAGYAVALAAGMVDFSPVAEAGWFFAPAPLQFGLDFHSAAIVAITVIAIASSVESIGDITAVARTGAGRAPTARELSGGVMADGIGTSIAAIFGGLPNTTYSQNTGVIALTGVVSRFVVAIAGGILLLAGFVPKIAAVFNTIPYPVLGGAVLVMFSMVASAGVQVIAQETLDRRALLILAVSLGSGLGFSLAPEEVLSGFQSDIQLLLGSGIVPAMLVAVVLNTFLPKTETEATNVAGARAGEPDAVATGAAEPDAVKANAGKPEVMEIGAAQAQPEVPAAAAGKR
ncbi:uracil-xanthine permease family protein [Nesterenkonia flava]|uniref:Nucleobase:cation symporter-2 family protein n=1 Tax=Nesterenkonia flava TaxID=469799 RepID=A0ABU1FWS3_9MICC|nr:nucleobase:cation symporter-2 family protein [Nesterenkonia flava]MDR5712571.1 nucleobase:cation symporter-2 family protein [Nesterenkonia flava]